MSLITRIRFLSAIYKNQRTPSMEQLNAMLGNGAHKIRNIFFLPTSG